MINRFFSIKRYLSIKKILLLAILLESTVLFASFRQTPQRKLANLAKQILERCSSVSFRPACFDEEIPRLMDPPFSVSLEDAFAVTRLVQKEDPEYLYCHVLGHKIAYKEAEKDVTKWKDIVARCPTTMCNNGCPHGAIMRRFNRETLTDEEINQLKSDISSVCEPRNGWKPVEVERSMCYHGVGHTAMFVTGGNIEKSLNLCNELGRKPDGRNYTQTCTEGVFMTVFQPLEAEDQALVKNITPKKEGVAKFCGKFSGEALFACRRESWPLFLEQIQGPPGLMTFCGHTGNEQERWKCFGTAMNILTVYLVVGNDRKLDSLTLYCTALPEKEAGWCFSFAAARLIQIDPAYVPDAAAVCRIAQEEERGKGCYDSVFAMIETSFRPNSKEKARACGEFPKERQSSCKRFERNP